MGGWLDVNLSSRFPFPLPVQAAGNNAITPSVEDDALGEELQVIWELEPGAHIHENVTLPEPTGFDY